MLKLEHAQTKVINKYRAEKILLLLLNLYDSFLV